MEVLDTLSPTPQVAKMNPAAALNVPDFHAAGGVPAVISELLPLLHGDAMTVNARTVAENVAGAVASDRRIIRPLANPWNTEGGLAVLAATSPRTPGSPSRRPSPRKCGSSPASARCFDCEEAANRAILDGAVREGDVVVIRYEGPKGGPGMREMYTAMKLLYGCGLALKTALVTDGRFSGTNNGCFVGHVSPEAAEGGPIAIVQDGDTITVDVPQRRLDVPYPTRRSRHAVRVAAPAGEDQERIFGAYCASGRVGRPRGDHPPPDRVGRPSLVGGSRHPQQHSVSGWQGGIFSFTGAASPPSSCCDNLWPKNMASTWGPRRPAGRSLMLLFAFGMFTMPLFGWKYACSPGATAMSRRNLLRINDL